MEREINEAVQRARQMEIQMERERTEAEHRAQRMERERERKTETDKKTGKEISMVKRGSLNSNMLSWQAVGHLQ